MKERKIINIDLIEKNSKISLKVSKKSSDEPENECFDSPNIFKDN